MNAHKIPTSPGTAQWILRIAFLSIGLVFLALGVTLFPVIGLFVGAAFIGLGFYPGLMQPLNRRIQVYMGSRLGPYSKNSRVIPVAILSTSQRHGDASDFDATTIDASSVRFGPNEVGPIGNLPDPLIAAEHIKDVNGDGKQDVVFLFPADETGITPGARHACISGKTIDGENIYGCSSLEPLSV